MVAKFSDNGWPGIPDRDDLATGHVPGTGLSFRLAPGGPDWVLTEFARRFHVEVESLDGPQLDDWSYAWRPVRGSTIHLSCHASGTAIDLNATSHLRGVKGTFGGPKLKRLRALLADFTVPGTSIQVIKWGGDFRYPSIVDEMHFQIRGTAADLAAVKKKLTTPKPVPVPKPEPKPEDELPTPRDVWTVPKFREFGDANNDGTREEVTPAEVLYRLDAAVQRLEKALTALLEAQARK